MLALGRCSVPRNSNLIPLLKNLLLAYQNSQVLDPKPLRVFLSNYYEQVNKFQLKEPADCIEALLAILEILHLEYSANTDCAGRCLSHQLFNLEVFEQYECDCRSTSEILTWDFCTFSLNFYADELVSEVTQHSTLDMDPKEFSRYSKSVKVKEKFPLLLKDQLEDLRIPACPEANCKKKSSKRKIHILNSSSNLIFSVIWFKQPTFLQICKLLSSIPQVFRGSQVSSGFPQDLYLTGLVLYNKVHYFSYIFNRQWYRCDDTIVRPLSNYLAVLEDAIRSNFWPVALFYSASQYRAEEVSIESIVNLEKMSILLEIEQSFNDSKQTWTCQCSTSNEDFLLYCSVCYRSRNSDFEWACDKCGRLNSEVIKQCLCCQAYAFQPTQSSYHSKLINFYHKAPSKSSNFYYNQTKARPNQSTQSVRFDKENSRKLIEEEKKNMSQKFLPFGSRTQSVRLDQESPKIIVEEEEKKSSQKFVNSTQVINSALNKNSQSSSFGQCLKCIKRVRNSKLCDNCKLDYWVCQYCNECWKKNGKRCNCDIKINRTSRF